MTTKYLEESLKEVGVMTAFDALLLLCGATHSVEFAKA